MFVAPCVDRRTQAQRLDSAGLLPVSDFDDPSGLSLNRLGRLSGDLRSEGVDVPGVVLSKDRCGFEGILYVAKDRCDAVV